MNKPVKKQTAPDWPAAVFFLIAVVGAYLIVGNMGFEMGRWVIGLGIIVFLVIYIFLGIIWAVVYSWIERIKFSNYLAGLPPGERLTAIDERFGGMIKKLTATPEYKRAEEEFRQKFEKRLKPILDTLEKTPGPISFSAQNQLAAKIKELEKELGVEKTHKTGSE
jgi:4-amino-4-deoxy-L-arabinose transferase-like glycosyltransferase